VEALRGIPECSVLNLSSVGRGCPDICVGYRGANFFFEIKNPKKPLADQGLTDDQKRFHLAWKGQVQKVFSLKEIITTLTGWNPGRRRCFSCVSPEACEKEGCRFFDGPMIGPA
jgi:hypothetical protein